MAVLRVGPLPGGALEAAARFHADVLPKALALLPNPPRDGEGDRPKGGGGGSPRTQRSRGNSVSAEGHLAIVFPSAPHDHRAWRLAVVESLARAAAPVRVNGIVGEGEAALAETLAFLETAPGVTGQLLAVEPA